MQLKKEKQVVRVVSAFSASNVSFKLWGFSLATISPAPTLEGGWCNPRRGSLSQFSDLTNMFLYNFVLYIVLCLSGQKKPVLFGPLELNWWNLQIDQIASIKLYHYSGSCLTWRWWIIFSPRQIGQRMVRQWPSCRWTSWTRQWCHRYEIM